ncbi:MAG TPA: hypothetical protein VEK07_02900, partial [Polyangiaceae bacterium]|nr:hypothetical protein [Polyangiaceae bacterium]
MNRHPAGRTWGFVPVLLSMGCAAAGRSAFAAAPSDFALASQDATAGAAADEQVWSAPVLDRRAY